MALSPEDRREVNEVVRNAMKELFDHVYALASMLEQERTKGTTPTKSVWSNVRARAGIYDNEIRATLRGLFTRAGIAE